VGTYLLEGFSLLRAEVTNMATHLPQEWSKVYLDIWQGTGVNRMSTHMTE